MFFEHIVPVHSDLCIQVSEMKEESTESSEKMERYLNGFRQLVDKMKSTRMLHLNKQPLFVWHDRNSASWVFEEQRVLHAWHKLLMQSAKDCFVNCDHRGARDYLTKAIDCCKQMIATEWVKTPYVKGMPELQLEYMLSLLFRTKGTYCYNMHMFKTSPPVARMAYKYVEIANCLWKKTADKHYENKLLAHYHHAVASKEAENISEDKDFDFKKLISHSTAAVSLLNDSKMLEDHETWSVRNKSVHYEEPEAVPVEVFTIEQALKKL